MLNDILSVEKSMNPVRLFRILGALSIVFLFPACHHPTRFEAGPAGGNNTVTVAGGSLYGINPGSQVCNPSATQDPVRYPGCMLFLNFSGKIKMITDNLSPVGVDTAAVYLEHDHLFVANKENRLRWSYERPADVSDLQDPQWSFHGDYIAFLGRKTSGWAGQVVRMSDKTVLNVFETGLAADADPCLWIGVSADSGTIPAPLNQGDARSCSKSGIQSYFGTSDVKYVFLLYRFGSLNLFFLDYRQNQAQPDTIRLSKPSDRNNWDVENPIISADGEWVTYHLMAGKAGPFAVYVQQLKRGAAPVLAATDAAFPAFWQGEGAGSGLYLVYARFSASVDDYYLQVVYDAASLGTLGDTWMQEISLSTGGPEIIRYRAVGDPVRLVQYPMKGGISKDGRFLSTGYAFAYLFELD